MCSFLFGSCDDSILPLIMSSRNPSLRDTAHLSIVSLDPTRALCRHLSAAPDRNYALCAVRMLRFCSMYCVEWGVRLTIEQFNRDRGPKSHVIFQTLNKPLRPHNEISPRGVALQTPENHL